MRVAVESEAALVFDGGAPVHAASAVAPFGGGWLVVQDDATHAAWCRPGSVAPVRVVEAVEGLEEFSAAAGTKHLKPDFEAACAVPGGVLLLGSGSSPARTRSSLLGTGLGVTVADLTPVYREVASALGLAAGQLNLEGACVLGDRLRWFQRANAAAGAGTAAVDADLGSLLRAAAGEPGPVPLHEVRRYDLGDLDGVALAVTDALALPDGRVLVSAAAEDTPNAVDDGPVTGSALALLGEDDVLDLVALPPGPGGPHKVEGLALLEALPDGLRLLAVTDPDEPTTPSQRLDLRLSW